MPTITNICGFELGTATVDVELTALSGTASIQSSIKRTGEYALQVNPTGANTGFALIKSISSTTGLIAGINLATAYYRFYFRGITIPASNSEEIFAVEDSSGSRKFSIRITSAGKLQAYAIDGTTQLGSDGATTVQAFDRIEVKVGSGDPAAYEVLINGISELSGTASLGANNSQIKLGKAANRNSNAVDFIYDDFALASDDYPGAGQCKVMQANADGNYTAYTIGAGSGDKWQQVDEVPPDEGTTYLLSTSVTNEAYTAALESAASGGISGTINAVKAMTVFAKSGSNMNAVVRLRSATTDSDTTSIANPSGNPDIYHAASKIALVDPATAAAWEVSALDSVEVGMVEKTTLTDRKHKLTGSYLMVDFVPEAPPATGGQLFAAVIG